VRGLAAFAALALLWPATAHSRYTFDPADLPETFFCDQDDKSNKCEEEQLSEAWYNKYGDRWEKWFFALAHNPNLFFGRYSYEDDPDNENYNARARPVSLLDIKYEIALRRYNGWTIAIDQLCEDAKPKQCRPILRMTAPKRFNDKAESKAEWERINADLELRGHPTSQAEEAEDMRITMDWLEADLRSCKGAMKKFLGFPGQTNRLWQRKFLDDLEGKPEPESAKRWSGEGDELEEIIVTTDGDSIAIRANGDENSDLGYHSVTIEQANGGAGYEWAKEFAAIVQPCLKPATSPAPWDKYLDWRSKQKL
jgi:hypothetical protein